MEKQILSKSKKSYTMKHALNCINLIRGIGWNLHQTLTLKFGDGYVPKKPKFGFKNVDNASIHQSSAPNFCNM
jgi:hypothetical protein